MGKDVLEKGSVGSLGLLVELFYINDQECLCVKTTYDQRDPPCMRSKSYKHETEE